MVVLMVMMVMAEGEDGDWPWLRSWSQWASADVSSSLLLPCPVPHAGNPHSRAIQEPAKVGLPPEAHGGAPRLQAAEGGGGGWQHRWSRSTGRHHRGTVCGCTCFSSRFPGVCWESGRGCTDPSTALLAFCRMTGIAGSAAIDS